MASREEVLARESPAERLEAMHRRRPRALLLGEAILALEAVLLLRLAVLVLLDSRVLADPSVMPPFVANAHLGVVQGLFVLIGPLVLAALTLGATRRPERVPWTRTQLAVAWVAIALAAMPIASVDFTVSILALGAVPAVLIGSESSLTHLRWRAGEPAQPRWSTRRRAGLTLLSTVVAVVVAAYLVDGAYQMLNQLPGQTTGGINDWLGRAATGLGGWLGR
jgi:hypothetical protein